MICCCVPTGQISEFTVWIHLLWVYTTGAALALIALLRGTAKESWPCDIKEGKIVFLLRHTLVQRDQWCTDAALAGMLTFLTCLLLTLKMKQGTSQALILFLRMVGTEKGSFSVWLKLEVQRWEYFRPHRVERVSFGRISYFMVDNLSWFFLLLLFVDSIFQRWVLGIKKWICSLKSAMPEGRQGFKHNWQCPLLGASCCACHHDTTSCRSLKLRAGTKGQLSLHFIALDGCLNKLSESDPQSSLKA